MLGTGRVLAAAAVLAGGALAVGASAVAEQPNPAGANSGTYEVWTIDQTDTRPGHGGLLHVYNGRDLEAGAATAQAETTDLGGDASAMCLERTGRTLTRPHMLVFNGGALNQPGGSRWAVVASVVSGHILLLDGDTREPLDCVRMSPGAGGAIQAHAMWPTPDQRHVIVANQNGKLLQRVRTDYAAGDLSVEPEATLSLFEGTTPSGAPKQDPVLRPDNAPICPRTTDDGRMAFVSLRGGGAVVVDHAATPMRIIAEYDKAHVGDNGCGQIEANGRMYVNAGAGAPGRPDASEVSSFELSEFRLDGTPPNTPAPTLVYRREGDVDALALARTKGEKYLLAGDRSQNDVTVVDTRSNEVLRRWSLTGPLSSDPAPDLFDLSPDDKLVFASLRGPAPLSGGHDAIGSSPGVGVIVLREGGRDGEVVGVAPARRSDAQPPDPHAIAVRTLEADG